MLDTPFKENGFEVLFKTSDEELNEILRISTTKMDYSFKTNELKITFNLYTDTIEKVRKLTIGMCVPVEVILMDPTCTINCSLFECPLGKIKSFEIKDISVHTDVTSGKLLQYVITFGNLSVFEEEQ